MSLAIVVAAPLLSTVFVTVSIRNPFTPILFRLVSSSFETTSNIYRRAFLRSFSRWLLVVFSISKNIWLTDKSMSSLNLSIKPQPLLRLVPPLKQRCSEHEHLNRALSTIVTQQSFSNANWSILNFSSARCNSAKRSGLVCFIQSAIIN